MFALDGVITCALEFVIHLVAGRNAEKVGDIHVVLIGESHSKRLCLEQVLGGLVILIDEQRDFIHCADHTPGCVHDIDLAGFVICGHHQNRHRIYGLHYTEILLHGTPS